MGTWGTGPFDSDGAMDLLEELAERPAEDRLIAVSDLFTLVAARPDLLMREYFPDEVVAAAALVAASLRGGENLKAELCRRRERLPAVDLDEAAATLAGPALHALQQVAGPDGAWNLGWVTGDSRSRAMQTTGDLTMILTQTGRTITAGHDAGNSERRS